LTLALGSGEAILLTGRNGAGKTSLLRMMAGLLPLDEGTLSWRDRSEDDEQTLAQSSHFIGAKDALTSELTAREHLAFWAQLMASGALPDARLREILQEVGISDLAAMPAGYLSSGQRRRLSLARLLVAPRELWLLDEPTNALDTASRSRLMDMITRHRHAGGMVVVATHDPLDLPEAARVELGAPLPGVAA
jgi:heme exporter protein A